MSKKVRGMIHSRQSEGPQYFDIVAMHRGTKQTDYIAEVVGASGVRVWCLAIFNPFSGLFYADDLYACMDDHPETYGADLDKWEWI